MRLPALVALAVVLVGGRAQGQAGKPISYKRQIAPILAANCNACHSGPGAQSGLTTSTHAALLKGGRRGKAVVPGDPGASLLVQYIDGSRQPRMPIGGALKTAEIALIRSWIAQGARTDGEAAAAAEPPRIRPKVPLLPQAAALAWTRDASALILGTYQEVRLLDPASGKALRVLGGHADVVRALAFSPDGTLLAAGGGVPGVGGEVKIWRLADGSLQKTLAGHSDCVYAVAWRPDGKQLATVSYDKTVRLWDPEKGQSVAELKEHADAVFGAAYTASGKYLVTGSADRSLRVWDAAKGSRLYTLAGHGDAVAALAVHPSADQVLSASADKTVKLWNLRGDGGDNPRTLGPHGEALTDARFSPDGKLIAAAAVNGEVTLWNAENGGQLRVIKVVEDAAMSVAFRPDGKVLAVGGYDGSVSLYSVEDGKLAAALIVPPRRAAAAKPAAPGR